MALWFYGNNIAIFLDLFSLACFLPRRGLLSSVVWIFRETWIQLDGPWGSALNTMYSLISKSTTSQWHTYGKLFYTNSKKKTLNISILTGLTFAIWSNCIEIWVSIVWDHLLTEKTETCNDLSHNPHNHLPHHLSVIFHTNPPLTQL